MKTSQNGINLIKRFEGLELESYQDIAGIWTIGYGHTGREVGPDQHISENEAEALLRHDLISREKAVSRLTRVALNQFEFDALVSFVYNVGVGAYERSTARKRLNKGDREGAADALTWFNKATVNGVLRPVTGLTRRRAAERSLFLTPTGQISSRPENVDDSTRVTPIEDAPRRGALTDSRTIQGATVAGASGVAASNMGKDASEELDQMETNIENGTSLTEKTDNPIEPVDDFVTTDEGDDGTNANIPPLAGDENSDTNSADHSDNNSTANNSPDTSTTPIDNGEMPADEELGSVVEVPAPPSRHERHETDAQIQFALMVVTFLAILYIIFARIDDWLKFRR